MIEAFRTAQLLCELRGGVYRDPGILIKRQGVLLRRAVAHACKQVPFYQRFWREAGMDPLQVRSLEDLQTLPVVTSETVRTAVESGELLAQSCGRDPGRSFFTGGSSGRPLQVTRGIVESRLWRTGGLRMQLAHGFRWRDTTVQFDAAPGPPHPLQKLGVAPAVWISNDQTLDERLELLKSTNARVFIGHTTILRRIARALVDNGIRLASPGMVFSMAEILDDDSRATIEAGFGVEPLDVYGMTEIGFIAWQCELRCALHINAELLVVEILREDNKAARPGELGRVVITDLRGRTMPMLRYDTGDLAFAAAPCPCGRTLPVMGPVEGRARHLIRTSDGRVLTQRMVLNGLAGTLRMGEYRLRRKSRQGFVLELTPRGLAAGMDETEACRRLHALLGDIDLSIERAAALPAGLKTHAVVDDRS